MRVLMTGGYGCIGSWVTRELVERGYDVWIFDLRADTHRLDLVLDPEKRSKVHFVAGDVSDVGAVQAAVERVGATHILHLAGLQTPTCRADPILGAKVKSARWRSSRRPWRSRIRSSAWSMPVRRQCTVRARRVQREASATRFGWCP